MTGESTRLELATRKVAFSPYGVEYKDENIHRD